MARKIIDIGVVGNDGTGDSIRDSFRKVNDNFLELYSSLGLGERLEFKNLSDVEPGGYVGRNDYTNPANVRTPVVTINDQETGLAFKQLEGVEGQISIDFSSPGVIKIGNEFNEIRKDESPALGGNLSAKNGDIQYTILNLPVYNRNAPDGDLDAIGGPRRPLSSGEAVSRSYVDAFVSRAGVNHLNPSTGTKDSQFGRMSGPLVLSRDPIAEDDLLYNGLVAATKRYVDSAAFGSSVNVYVASTGEDERIGLSPELQGSSLAYAYKSIEAALKRAEELIIESPVDIGPYKKTLSYGGDPSQQAILSRVVESPESGTGFEGFAVMTLDTIELVQRGINYFVGDELEIVEAGASVFGGPIRLRVTATESFEGGQISDGGFTVLSGGSYNTLPPTTNATVRVVSSAAPPGVGAIGLEARFNLTFKVNRIRIPAESKGSGYGLVSVRIQDSQNNRAFGVANVNPVGGSIESITVTNPGGGFTSVPTVTADLPRFLIYTDGRRTDFTGDVLNDTPTAIRGRDIREGLYLRGERSGAIAQILAHNGDIGNIETGLPADDQIDPIAEDVDNRYEIFDVDIQVGSFEPPSVFKGTISGTTLTVTEIIEGNIQIGDILYGAGIAYGTKILSFDTGVGGTGLYVIDTAQTVSTEITITSGEPISYGDITKQRQVSVLIESGVYEENYPLKLPQNTAIIGDEFRRVIIKPKSTGSSSPWAMQKFRRDTIIGADIQKEGRELTNGNAVPSVNVTDTLEVTTQLYGYHYLEDASKPVLPKINNRGNFIAAATLLRLNKSFIQEEVVAWINSQISGSNPLFVNFVYNDALCKRDIGLIINSMIYDLNYSGYDRTVSAGLKYYENASSQLARGAQLEQTVAAIERLEEISQFIIRNQSITNSSQDIFTQIVDPAFIGEIVDPQTDPETPDASTAVRDLVDTLVKVIRGTDPDFNPPKLNDQMDVFLCNDANIVRAVTCQGHGGFMMVLDPTGQILTKSPYAQESASFSKSINKQTFAGGLFVDGFSGNVQFKHQTTINPTRISVSYLDRVPNLPSSFIVNDQVYRINYVRDFVYNPDPDIGSSATLVLDETTPFDPILYPPGAQTCTFNTVDPVIAIFTGSIGIEPGEEEEDPDVGVLTVTSVTQGTIVNNGIIIGTGIPAGTRVIGPAPSGGGSGGTGRYIVTFVGTVGSTTINQESILEINKAGHRLQSGATIIFSGADNTLPVNIIRNKEYFVLFAGLTENKFRVSDTPGSLFPVGTTDIGSGTHTYQRIYELLTPGNRSMLANDFTQINDLGYGLVATNGGLIEAVSVFTYYNWISYYSLNGGQIRSIGGSSAHGKYALVAQGSDPLELPTPCSIYHELSQGLTVYWPGNSPSSSFRNEAEKTIIFVTYDDFTPLNDSEIEIQHNDRLVSTYAVSAVTIKDLPIIGGKQVARLTISTEGGFEEATPDGTRITWRAVNRLVLTGNLAQVSVRPSTGLILNELPQEVYRVLQFLDYEDPNGPYTVTLTPADTEIVSTEEHTLREGYTIRFFSSVEDGLPANFVDEELGRSENTVWYVVNVIDENTFEVSDIKNGLPVAPVSAGSGTITYKPFGLTNTQLRENYNFIELKPAEPGEFVTGSETTCTFTDSSEILVVNTLAAHGLSLNDVIRFEPIGEEDILPSTMSGLVHYHVVELTSSTSFKISTDPEGTEIEFADAGTGTFQYGLITGRVGDESFGIQPLTGINVNRVVGSRFVFKGEKYEVLSYDTPVATGSSAYGRINLDRPLVDSVIDYSNSPTLKAGAQPNTVESDGSLTIRISLTRVTGHDLLDIGTGSYADTNYPNEIYGASVGGLIPANEVQERNVGRVFFVTTDQFGNFTVGPYFRVDQGTGTVTFSASIAISNLNGLGFKRGVSISEFSTDTSFGDAALDKVPVEFAIRTYVDRRLGVTHDGVLANTGDLIPLANGGFMALNGLTTMKAEMKLGNNRIAELGDPASLTDAVNKRSLTFENFQDTLGVDTPAINDLMVFTGSEENAVNATVSGDVVFENLNTGTNAVSSRIIAGAVTDSKVSSNSADAITQAKLALTLATTRAAAPTGTAQAKQAASGVASFNNGQFEITDGFVSVKTNGISASNIQALANDNLIANISGSTATPTSVAFSEVVNRGGAVKKTQFGQNGTSTGFLRRITAGSSDDSAFTTVEASSTWVGAADNGKLVLRDSNGDFNTRIVTANQINLGVGITNNSAIVRNAGTGGAGNIRYFGFNAAGGLIVGGGGGTSDRVTKYLNDSHVFRNSIDGADAPIKASSVETLALTTGSNTTSGTITGRWTLTGTSPNESRLQATYSADLAEYYEGDKEYEVGTVLIFGGDKEVTVSNKEADTRVAGVVSNTAAFVMYDACPGYKNLVALQGRVPCKVVGKIEKGDILVTSRITGVAVSVKDSARAGTIIGKALENYNSDHIGMIEVAVGRN
jgi:hypothetical protein